MSFPDFETVFDVVECEVKDVAPYFLFSAIKNGSKTREVRIIPRDIPSSKWRRFMRDNYASSFITLKVNNGAGAYVIRPVIAVTQYSTFEELLKTEGHGKCVPGATYEEALNLYKSIYSDEDNIRSIVCLHFRE